MNEGYFPLLVIAIFFALVFDFINGFHDAANSIATIVSTRVLKPLTAVVWAAFFNLIAMVIFGPRVAETVSQIIRIDASDPTYMIVILAGLIGAILWNLLTWWFGLPTSSSHAIIGGISGAALTYGGISLLEIKTMLVIIEFIFLSPMIGFFLGFLLVWAVYWLFRKEKPGEVDHLFRRGQLVSAALYSIGHGANDAQKTMGVILALLIAGNVLSPQAELSLYHPSTSWVIFSCQLVMSLGTLFGGWRIVKTMGMKITKLRPVTGFCAETAGALTLFSATLLGIPVSTTHTITGAIIGVGSSTTAYSGIKWGVAARIVWAWILTLPGAGFFSSVIFLLIIFFKTD